MSQQPPNYPQPPYGDQSFGGQQQPTNYPPQQPYEGQPQYGQQFSYPSQQPMMPPQQPKKKHTGRNAIIAVVVVVVLLAACGGIAAAISNAGKSSNTGTVVNNNTGSTATTGNTQATSAPIAPSTFKVGQVVSVGSTWQITVLSAKTSTGSQFITPKAGNEFLVFQVSVKNISGQSQNMSSLIQWNLQDTTGQKYTITIDPDAGATLDGAVAAGSPLKGAIVYEVPKTIHNFVLSFQNDITSSDQTIWNITV